MPSSMHSGPGRRHCRARPGLGRLTVHTLLATGLLVASVVFPEAPPARAAVNPTCPVTSASPAAPASIIAEVPWPQQRYDLAALSQITDGAGVTVAVIDSGVDAIHAQLSETLQAGEDLLDRGEDGRVDCVGHGTAVASIIAAQPAHGSGLRGLATGVDILPIRVSERQEIDGAVSGRGTVATVVDGVRAAVAHDAQVINLSISTTRDDPRLRRAVRDAIDADIVVVAAVGNQHERGDPTPYPAAYPGVVGVSAIGRDGLRVSSSQVGRYVDIVAPGADVVAAVPVRGHRLYQGTSFAAPFVAATAALIRAAWPDLGQADVVRRLLATADPAPGARPSEEYGFGVLNPVRALTEIVPPPGAQAPAWPQPTVSVPDGSAVGGDRRQSSTSLAVGVAAFMAIVAAGVTAVAAATPLGRRRRWRPGRLTPPTLDRVWADSVPGERVTAGSVRRGREHGRGW